MAKQHEVNWGEQKRKKAVRAFRRAHAEWTVASNETRCPAYAKQYPFRQLGLNFCEFHHWANEKRLTGGKGAVMIIMMALRDPRLREELEAEGLK